MPDFIVNSTFQFINILKNPYSFFGEELLQCTEIMNDLEIESLIQKLGLGLQKGFELHQKWFDSWLHLPLSICRLGGNNAHQFACSYWHVILKKPWPKIPSLKELCYAQFLMEDITTHKEIGDFGLGIALTNESFFQEFSTFVHESNVNSHSLYKYPQLYDFVKNKIWYIAIHQQQIEGLFNKWDLKTHPNMTNNTQQSKMRLAATKVNEIQFNIQQLKTIRSSKKKHNQLELNELNLDNSQQEQAANLLFDELFSY
jgi:hypothetical protein